jgi:hypothetical protein
MVSQVRSKLTNNIWRIECEPFQLVVTLIISSAEGSLQNGASTSSDVTYNKTKFGPTIDYGK